MDLMERRRMMLMQGEGGGDDLIMERGQYTVYKNYYVDSATGDLVPYNGWTSTDYIDVSQGYMLSEKLSPNYTAFYDEQKNRISNAATIAENSINIMFIIPKAEVKFMRISYTSSQHPVVYILKAGAIVIK